MINLPISKLVVTHNRLRNPNLVKEKLQKYLDGELVHQWPENPIPVVKTEDGIFYLWDSHHNICFNYLIGESYVPYYKVNIINMTYRKVMECNLEKGYVTPFDMANECRLPDFSEWKNSILEDYKYVKSSNLIPSEYEEVDIIHFIYEKIERYKEPRKVQTVEELINASGLSNI